MLDLRGALNSSLVLRVSLNSIGPKQRISFLIGLLELRFIGISRRFPIDNGISPQPKDVRKAEQLASTKRAFRASRRLWNDVTDLLESVCIILRQK